MATGKRTFTIDSLERDCVDFQILHDEVEGVGPAREDDTKRTRSIVNTKIRRTIEGEWESGDGKFCPATYLFVVSISLRTSSIRASIFDECPSFKR